MIELYPAIDLRGGQVVRLRQGDYADETVYGDDPVAVARSFADAGATWIHIVDLDAAKSGDPVNRPIIEAVARAVVSTARVQTGGGDRSEKIRTYNYKENRVSDHRIGLTLYKLDKVLQGELDEIIDALVADERSHQLQEPE